MLSILEQKILLLMLKNGGTYPNSKTKVWYIYRALAKMNKNELITINIDKKSRLKKVFQLTVYGTAMASCIAKDYDTDPQYKKYAKTVEMFLV